MVDRVETRVYDSNRLQEIEAVFKFLKDNLALQFVYLGDLIAVKCKFCGDRIWILPYRVGARYALQCEYCEEYNIIHITEDGGIEF
jgi:hypothetical protein